MRVQDILLTNNWFNYEDYYSAVAKRGYKTFAEIGVWKGHSISFLAKKVLDQEVSIYAVDLFEDTTDSAFSGQPHITNEIPFIREVYNANLQMAAVRDKIIDIKSTSWEAARCFNDEYFDFVFIDADHSYECVKKDIEAWIPKVRKGGVLAGDDFRHKGVCRAVREFFGDNFTRYRPNVWEFTKQT